MKKKTIRILYWIFTILLATFMIFSAVTELSQTESAQKVLTDLGYPIYLNYILGVAKILAAIAILQPKFKTVKEWAYAGVTIDFLGATASMVLVGGGIASVLFMLPFFVILFISYALWKKI